MAQRIAAGRYELLREVGRGGMATVYLCDDLKHHRQVALKVLRPDLAAVIGAERFLREIEITAGLNHPHILPLLDSGAEDGLLYYVMPYVAGGSLRLLLAGGEVPLEAVTHIARDVSAALDYAHAHGVVHRDVKPENVLFNEGVPVVADFGIARAVSGASAGKLTITGLSVGTLGYMSPEQALGTSELDGRTDVYSLGCVIYELLVGATPASWPGAEDVELGRFADLPAGHRARLDRHPGRVEQVLVRALALRPQHRYGRPSEFASALSAASQPTPSFTDEQVRQLLHRAAELQASSPGGGLAPEGLTIGAVEQIAAQVGIPPVHVREAARGVQPGHVAGAAPEARARRIEPHPGAALPVPEPVPLPPLPGQEPKWDRLVANAVAYGEVTEEQFPAMVDEIERRLGIVGHVSVMGGTLTWSPAAQGDEARRVVVQVSARDGQTAIRIQETLELQGWRKVAVPGGIVMAAAFAGAWSALLGLVEPASAVLMLVSGFFGGFAGVRSAAWLDASGRGPALQLLAKTLARMVSMPALEPHGRADPEPGGRPRTPMSDSP